MDLEPTGLMQLQQFVEDTVIPTVSIDPNYDWVPFFPAGENGQAADFIVYPDKAMVSLENQVTPGAGSSSDYGSDGGSASPDYTSASSDSFFPLIPNDGEMNATKVKVASPKEKSLTKRPKKPRAWSNPNLAADPIYGDEGKNIFLKLQKKEIRNNEFNPLDEFRIHKPLPPPDDMDVQIIDSNYMSYFLREVPLYMGCICLFPEMLNIFMQSVNTPIVRHSILALSSTIQQPQSGLATLYVQRNIQHIIPHIKQAITEVHIDAAHMVSVTFLGWLSLTANDLHTAHRHFRGLFSMLKLTHHLSATAEPLREPPHTLTMFLYRMAHKADNTLCYRNQPQVFPPTRFLESYHREWLQNITSSEVHIQYSLATIQLDDIANNINHLHREANQLRRFNFPDTQQILERKLRPLRIEHGMWVYRPYIQRHLRGNDPLVRSGGSNPEASPVAGKSTFLSHPEYIIYDPMVAYMHMQHSYLSIHMNIVETGRTDDEDSYELGILVCRIFAALNGAFGNAGKILNGCVTALWFAGIPFTNDKRNCAQNLAWVTDLLAEIDKGSTYRTANRLREALLETQRTKCDPWKAVGDAFQKKYKATGDSPSSVSPSSSTSSTF